MDASRTGRARGPPSPRITAGWASTPAGPETRGLAERCIAWGSAGPPMQPTTYNSNFQLLQTPDHVAIVNEMIHDVRIVPLDGRPHIASGVRQLLGDSRGHWEGETLVVVTANFTDKTRFRGSSPDLHLVERFTRVDEDTPAVRVHPSRTNPPGRAPGPPPWPLSSLQVAARGGAGQRRRAPVRVCLPRGQLRHDEPAGRRPRPGAVARLIPAGGARPLRRAGRSTSGTRPWPARRPPSGGSARTRRGWSAAGGRRGRRRPARSAGTSRASAG